MPLGEPNVAAASLNQTTVVLICSCAPLLEEQHSARGSALNTRLGQDRGFYPDPAVDFEPKFA